MRLEALKLENQELCKVCGGRCCKNGGCAYLSEDFEELKVDYIMEVLKSGRISIAASLDFSYTKNGVPFANPTLYLREREINRGEIDLISIRSQCVSLEEDHCHYEILKRPTMGATMEPNYPHQCKSSISTEDFIANWEPYQKVLERVVKRITGKSVDEKIKEDVENLFFKLYSKQKEEYDSNKSIYAMSKLLKDFELAFPEQAEAGIARSLQNVPFALLRDYKK